MNLVDAALDMGFEAFVNAGSSSEYGFTDHPPTEDERAEPSSAYALTKLSQTLFCRFTAKKHDVHMPTLRLYSVYGPYEEPTRFVPRSLLTDSTDDFRSSPLRMSPAISFPSTTSRRPRFRFHRRRRGGIRPRRRAKRHRAWRRLQRGHRDPNEATRRRPPRPRDVRDHSRARMGDDAESCMGYDHVGRERSQDRTRARVEGVDSVRRGISSFRRLDRRGPRAVSRLNTPRASCGLLRGCG